jgi:hypothetical protein
MADERADPPHPDDQYILEALRTGGDWLRAVLCTLARRGVAFREAHPERAHALLQSLSTFPIYKGFQFLFDLMEWEDFMIDGSLPTVRATALNERSVQRLATLLNTVRQHLDGDGALTHITALDLQTPPVNDEELPPLEAGFFLYQDVVLGVIRSVVAARTVQG